VAALIPFALGIKYGIMWLLWGSVVLSVFQFTLDVLFTGKQIGYTMKMWLKDMVPSAMVGIAMYAAVWPLRFIGIPVLLMLVLQVLVGVILVVALSKTFKLEEYQEIVGMVKPWMNKVLKRNKKQG
jgi:peptidoglycan/LPS O-acetylase OafA/YrhL